MGEGEWLHLLGDLLQGPHCGLARFSCLSSKARPLGGKKRAEKMVRRLPLLFSHVPSVSVRCLGVTEHVNTELLLTSLFTCLPPGYRRYDFHQMFAVLELEFNLFLNSRVVILIWIIISKTENKLRCVFLHRLTCNNASVGHKTFFVLEKDFGLDPFAASSYPLPPFCGSPGCSCCHTGSVSLWSGQQGRTLTLTRSTWK